MTPIPANSENDAFTRSILGERLLLTMGRPVALPGAPKRYKPAVREVPKVRLNPWNTLLFAALLGSPFLGYVGWKASAWLDPNKVVRIEQTPAATQPKPQVILPIEEPGQSVQVVDQEYVPGGPLPVLGGAPPAPLPGQPVNMIPLPEVPLPAKPREEPKKEQEPKSAVLVDLSAGNKNEAPAEKKEPEKKEPEKRPVPPPKEAARKNVAPPSAILPAVKPEVAKEAQAKLARPVEEKSPGVTMPAAEMKPSAPAPAKAEQKVTIVDIAQGGGSVLVTNPATRLPTRLSVGDKLPNGKVIQSIDEKAGSIKADGTVYKLD